MRNAAWAAVVATAAVAGCAAPRAGDAAEAPRVAIAAPAPPETAVAAAPEWEPWPPPGRRDEPRPAASGDLVEFPDSPQGVPALELLRFVSEKTGSIVFYDDETNQKLKSMRVQRFGAWRVPRSRLLDACRAALHYENMTMVPVGAGSDAGAWYVLDQNNPMVKTKPVYLTEEQVLGYADADGLYVVTTLRLRDMVDSGRVRQALMQLTTQTAAIGRVQDVAGGRALLVGDFAPVVASMKRVLDVMNAEASPPPPSPAPAKQAR